MLLTLHITMTQLIVSEKPPYEFEFTLYLNEVMGSAAPATDAGTEPPLTTDPMATEDDVTTEE